MDEKTVKESFEQAEGIDTISFEVFPQFVNTQNWWNRRQILNGVSLEVRKSKYKYHYHCHIQAEALNQNLNLRGQVKSIVAKLYQGHFIDFKCMNANPYELILRDVEQLIQLTGVDFHFDFKEKDVKFPRKNTPFPTTIYSKDHEESTSLWIIYDRRPYLHKVNQIKSDLIDSMPYPMRVEIRARKSNCAYIDLDNLNGNYYQVLLLYMRYIAKSWRSHSPSLCPVSLRNSNRLFNFIQLLAFSGKSLSIGENLKKTPKRQPSLNKTQENNKDILNELLGNLSNESESIFGI